jgi:hypothetical protein
MRFEIHWCEVPPPGDAPLVQQREQLLALWPAPVNADECFKAAGFTDFEDSDESWDNEATALLSRVIEALKVYGPPQLKSQALSTKVPWFKRRFSAPSELPLLEQLELPMHWDSLPSCVVNFGSAGASVRTGNGHVLMWVTLPEATLEGCKAFASGVAASHPLFRTPLKWSYLNISPPKPAFGTPFDIKP